MKIQSSEDAETIKVWVEGADETILYILEEEIDDQWPESRFIQSSRMCAQCQGYMDGCSKILR